MTAQRHFIFWTLAFAAFMSFLFVFKSILLPFVLGLVIAYLLNPMVNSFARFKLDRGPAALLILFCFFAIVASLIAVLVPVLYRELVALSEDMPIYIDKASNIMQPYVENLRGFVSQDGGANLKELAGQHAATGLNAATKVLAGLAIGGMAIFDFILLVVVTPVVAYFMMKEWTHITRWTVDMMPRNDMNTILDLLHQIDRKLSGFIRGQISVAFILAVIYSIALAIAGLKYGILIGFAAGLLSVIPMVGSAVGLITGVLVAWFQTGEWTFVAIIAAIFLVGQFIEGNFLTPKIVGDRIGLHPLWIFFALMAGGSLLGFLGLLIAVPVAAVVSVLAAFGIKKYKASSYYKALGKKNG
jgi:predicted PurR-regulated permease PerM